ncbi:MAG: hypothetical protein A2Z72_06205 [Omnitrophica bacterium RBG_13_46_9]|nr:MAG: hypothetical protein A2Z72_06205 [Omnitrophica bacterium RBG_13_46_9]
MKKSNIALIGLYDTDSFSICTLHATLKREAFNVSTIFFKRLSKDLTIIPPQDREISCLVRQVKELNPDIIGISVRTVLFQIASQITKAIKQESGALVVWGGVHPTIRPCQCLESADIVCVGEGEGPIVDLATRFSKGEGIDDIKNLCFKKNGAIIRNEIRPLVENLDSMPFPDYSSEDKYFLENGKVLPHRAHTNMIMTSRGCPFSCSFCCNSALRKIYDGKGRYVRRRSVDNVIDELIQAKKTRNLKNVSFQDDVFTFDIEWLREFCGKYKKFIDLPFFCYCHPRATTEEMVRLLKEAGFCIAGIGIQSGSEEFRHRYLRRYDTNVEIVKCARLLSKYGIDYHCDILMDNPLETEKERQETFNLLMRLPKPFFPNTHTLTYFPELELTNLLLEKGMISEEDIEDKKQESYRRWTPHLDLTRDKENMFWDDLYFLASRKLPESIAIGLSRNIFLKRHPKLLTLPLRCIVRTKAGKCLLFLIRKGKQCLNKFSVKKRDTSRLWGEK